MAKIYCDSKELEEWWSGWSATGDDRNWKKMQEMLYSICLGISKNFRPKSEDEYHDLANQAFIELMKKIVNGKLRFTPTHEGGAPVFNLITTTVNRLLCSIKNKNTKRIANHSKYVRRVVQEQAPELLGSLNDQFC